MTQTNSPNTDSPLHMTVHALPTDAAQQAPGDGRSVTAGRIKMLLVFLLCASPVIASYFTYYVLRPEGRRNYGELVEQRSMPANLRGQDLLAASGGSEPNASQPLTALRDQWLLVSVAGGACDAACEKHLFLQRQLREITGKEKERIYWVWLVNDDAPLRENLKPGLAAAGAVVWRVPPAELAAWLQPAAGQQLQNHLYVVDPMGNWMMRFPAELDIAKTKRDIDRLLRASRHWDTAGRDPNAAANLPAGAAK